MKAPKESTTAERQELHAEKMRNKKAQRWSQQTRLSAAIADGRYKIEPNAGKSRRIWPKGKVAKPGRSF